MTESFWSRRGFMGALPLAAAPTAASAAASSPDRGAANTINVDKDGPFPDVSAAMAAIKNASADNPYLIDVAPGVYDLRWAARPWVTVRGSGPLATIFEGSGNGGLVIPGSNVHLRDFGVRYTGSSNSDAAIGRSGGACSVYLENIHVLQRGRGAAVRNAGDDTRHTWWLSRLKIRSESVGLDLGGHVLVDDTKVALFGDHSGWPHIGCRIADANSRLYLNNCRIGTGYWYEQDENGLVDHTVSGEDAVIAIWLPRGVSPTRVEVHGLESFCRNETTGTGRVPVNVLRVEDGWLRAFGCFGQAETPGNWSIRESVYQAEPGKLELFGCRFSQMAGTSFGAPNLGVQTFDSTSDGYEFDKFEGGLHLLDAGGGDFTLRLRAADAKIPQGEMHVFKKTSAGNTVTLDLNGATLDDSEVNPTLSAQHETLRIVWGGGGWHRV